MGKPADKELPRRPANYRILGPSHAEFAEMIACSRPMATVLIGEMLADGSLYRQGLRQYVVPHDTMKRPFSTQVS